jgi:predicted nucleotide-binding protein (sugar kinase/HSP70/actin superfamily)
LDKQNLPIDINATIAHAINARLEAEMLAALSGDETIAAFITAALQEPVKKDNDSYRHETEPYLHHVLRLALQEAAKSTVARFIEEEVVSIEDQVRKALRRNINQIAETLTKSLVDVAGKPYGVSVEINLKMPERSYG